MKKKIQPNRRCSFGVVGASGEGKSSILNLILNCPYDYFITGNSQLGVTRKPLSLTIGNFTLWDLPGFFDPQGEDGELMAETLRTFQTNPFNAFGLVYNISNVRIGAKEKELIGKLSTLFTSPEIWRHFVIIFTHCDNDDFMYEARTIIGPKIGNEFFKLVKQKFPSVEKYITNFPCFYFYSKRSLRDKSFKEDSLKEVQYLLNTITAFSKIEKQIFANKIEKRRVVKQITRQEDKTIYVKDDGFFGNFKRFFAHTGQFVLDLGSLAVGLGTGGALMQEASDFVDEGHNYISNNVGWDAHVIKENVVIKRTTIFYSDGTEENIDQEIKRTPAN